VTSRHSVGKERKRLENVAEVSYECWKEQDEVGDVIAKA